MDAHGMVHKLYKIEKLALEARLYVASPTAIECLDAIVNMCEKVGEELRQDLIAQKDVESRIKECENLLKQLKEQLLAKQKEKK